MATTPNMILVRTYTRNVYLYGTYELHDNRGPLISDVHPDYVDAVMQQARDSLTNDQITNALATGYITQAEYDATMALTPTPAP